MKQWRGALKELKINTDKKAPKPEDGERTPDSMHERVIDSAIGMDSTLMEKLEDGIVFTSMGSRVSTFAA